MSTIREIIKEAPDSEANVSYFETIPAVTRQYGMAANSDCKNCDDEDSTAITLNILKADQSSGSTRKAQPRSPTPRCKFSEKRPDNLRLKIPIAQTAAVKTALTETENATLSSIGIEGSATPTTIFPHEQHKTLKKLDIGFDNIQFSTKTGFLKRENKSILKGLHGEFRNGELSAIIGPSGAGKSTFLNILSGYTAFGYDGDITVNGHVRDIKVFKQNVAFIRQDTSLQPYLTVKEAMEFAANLKIGAHMTKTDRVERVRKILEAMGLYDNRHTRTGSLSGGQKKRLAIAMELVNNPPVLILDEPTSGLDSSTSNQCITLLKKLAIEGRTVICTIHQASALSFEMFDHLYAVARGECIYAGASQNLVPFLAEMGLQCPESYNPADYLMEIATDDYGEQNHNLVTKLQNGLNNEYRYAHTAKKAQQAAIRRVDKMMASGLVTPVTAPVFTPLQSNSAASEFRPIYPYYHQCTHQQQHQHANEAQPIYQHNYQHSAPKPLTPIKEMSSRVWDSRGNGIGENGSQPSSPTIEITQQKRKQSTQTERGSKLCKHETIYATPFYNQLGVLLLRTFLILWRDSSLTTMRFFLHFMTALLIGVLYYGIGNDAGNALNNFRYVFYTIMFIMYCAFSSILVKFPLEFPIVSREHFNRWYSLRAYYIAITLADIPIQVICTGLFVATTYVMTGQPLEFFRFALFFFIVFLTALVGQSIGLAVGASLSVQLGAVLGPFFICPFLAFSGFFLQERDMLPSLQWVFHTSFLKYSLDGGMLSLFGWDRPKLECTQMYCHFTRPRIFLKYLDMTAANYEVAIIFLLSAFLGLRILSFYIMSFRLRLFR